MKTNFMKFILLILGVFLFSTNSMAEEMYVPGELIVKLKDDISLAQVSKLISKYEISASEKVFKDISSPEKDLAGLKAKFNALEAKNHASWYWQLDKNSQEYKGYLKNIEKEKQALKDQIKAKEELVRSIEERQKNAPQGVTPPNLENIYLFKTNSKLEIPVITQEFSKSPMVEYAQPNFIVQAQSVPDDPYYSSQGSWGQDYDDLWRLKIIDVEHAWDLAQGENVIVGLVDSGVDYTHPDLQGKVILGRDFVNSDDDPKDDRGHGTMNAGIIAAIGNNDAGIIGVAYKAKILAIKSLGSDGRGTLTNLGNGIKYAADYGAKVINNSYGELYGYGADRSFEKDMIDYAYGKGCVLIAAVGNGPNTIEGINNNENYPGTLNKVITVSATGRDDFRADYSNYSYKIDVSAPGGDSNGVNYSRSILSLRAEGTNLDGNTSLIISDKYYRSRGTSFSAAHVSGVAALILSRHPNFTNEEVRQALRVSADDKGDLGFDKYYGWGRLNAYKAVQLDSVCAAHISSPEVNDIAKIDSILQIRGVAYGANFKNYKLEYGLSSNGPWTQFGAITNTPVSSNDGLLGNLSLSKNYFSPGNYFIRLNVTDTADRVYQDIISIYVAPVRSGFPLYGRDDSLARGSTQNSAAAFTVADVNKDGSDEIVVANSDYGTISIYKDNGQLLLPEIPMGLAPTEKIISDIACADIDNNGDLEIFAVGQLAGGAVPIQKLCGFHHDGTAMPLINIDLTTSSAASSYAISVCDINNDGAKEIIVAPAEFSGQYGTAYINIFKPDGTIFARWQVCNGQSSFIKNGGPAIGDINGDGNAEIIIPLINSSGAQYLKVFSNTGVDLGTLNCDGIGNLALVNNFPQSLDKNRPIIADINHDNIPEIIYSAVYPGTNTPKFSRIFAWAWVNSSSQFNRLLAKNIAGETTALAVGDINNDDYLEIAFGIKRATIVALEGCPEVTVYTNVICILKYDGSKFWEASSDPKWILSGASPVIGDIRNADLQNSNKEIIFWGTNLDTGYPQIRVYGRLVDTYPNYVNYENLLAKYEVPVIAQENSLSSVALTYLDSSRSAQLVFVAQQPKNTPQRSALMVWDVGPVYYHSKMAWPQFSHDAAHTSNYHYSQPDYLQKGDVNKDGDITVPVDTYLACKQARGIDAYTQVADMDNNGRITLDDITAIASVYQKRGSSFMAHKVEGLLKDIPAQKVAAGGLLSFKVDALSGAIRPSYAFHARPQGVSINSDGQVRWQTTSRQGGKYNIRIAAYYVVRSESTAGYIYDVKDIPVTVQAAPLMGNFSGVVYDRKKSFGWWSRPSLVRNADVFVSRVGGGATYWASTNYNGVFTLKNLPEGDYSIAIYKYWMPIKRATISVQANRTTQKTFYLIE